MTPNTPSAEAISVEHLADVSLAKFCAARDRTAIRQVIAANNQRLFRAAWSILRSKPDAEEVVQAAYMLAFANIGAFEGRSSLSTWLTRIVVNEAIRRRRSEVRRRQYLEQEGVAVLDDYRDNLSRASASETPDAAAAREQIRNLLEAAVAQLPDAFRTVFVLREVEGLSSEETADLLKIAEATVRTRLFRARRLLQELLAPEVRSVLTGAFPFAGRDCAEMADRVVSALGI